MNSEISLDKCLNIAVNLSTYSVLAKIDNDLYLENYLFDQWIALKYSKAELIGKSSIYFYFDTDNIIALNNDGASQTYSEFIFGATLMANYITMKVLNLEMSEQEKILSL